MRSLLDVLLRRLAAKVLQKQQQHLLRSHRRVRQVLCDCLQEWVATAGRRVWSVAARPETYAARFAARTFPLPAAQLLAAAPPEEDVARTAALFELLELPAVLPFSAPMSSPAMRLRVWPPVKDRPTRNRPVCR